MVKLNALRMYLSNGDKVNVRHLSYKLLVSYSKRGLNIISLTYSTAQSKVHE